MKRGIIVLVLMLLLAVDVFPQLQQGENRFKFSVGVEGIVPSTNNTTGVRQGIGIIGQGVWNPESGGFGFIMRTRAAHNWSTETGGGVTTAGAEGGVEAWFYTSILGDRKNSGIFLNGTVGYMQHIATGTQYGKESSSVGSLSLAMQGGVEYMARHRVWIGVLVAQPRHEGIPIQWTMFSGGFAITL